MTRRSYLIQVLSTKNLPNILVSLRNALVFELFYLWWRLAGQKATHFLQASPPPEGRYIVTRVIPPIRLTLLGRTFRFSEEWPVEYIPYTPEIERQLHERTGKPAMVVDVAYKFETKSEQTRS